MDNLIEIIKHFSKTTKIFERKFAVVINNYLQVVDLNQSSFAVAGPEGA